MQYDFEKWRYDKRSGEIIALFSEMDLMDLLRGMTNNISHGLKKTRSLDSDENKVDDTQP